MFPLKILNSSFIVFIKASFSSQFCFHSSVVKHNKNCQQSQADRQYLQSTSFLLPWELQSHPRAEWCFYWDLSRRVCFPVCAILWCMSELLWRNAYIKIGTVLCISDCTLQIQIKSSLYIEVQINISFQDKQQFNLHCSRSSVFHTEILPMPYKVNLSNEIKLPNQWSC